MSSTNRRPYLTATVLNQALLDSSHDNLTCQLEVAVDIETPSGFIRASDRNKYVDGVFYEALLVVPAITRTVGDWLSPELTFSELSLELSNADGRFNDFLPGGAQYEGWIGKSVRVRMGLRDVGSSYFTLFDGFVSQVGGFGRTTSSILLRARDSLEKLSAAFPRESFGFDAFPKIEEQLAGKAVPIIYGDWTVETSSVGPSVPAFVVNGADPLVFRIDQLDVLITQANPGLVLFTRHGFENDDEIQFATSGALPSPLIDGTSYFVTVIDADSFAVSSTIGGPLIQTTTVGSGAHQVKLTATTGFRNAQCRMSNHALTAFDIDSVQIRRGEINLFIDPADIVNVGVNLNSFEVLQNAATLLDGNPLTFKKGDQFFVKVKGKDFGSYDDNLITQARAILEDFGGATLSDFDSNWDTFRDLPQISAIKSRVWIQDPQPAIQYALSMLEQVRLEMFVSRARKLTLSSLRIEDLAYVAGFKLNGFDIERGTLKPTIDERNNFNRSKAAFAFLPDLKENGFFTATFKNQDAIDQAGREISKQVAFPNLYIASQVTDQLVGILKIASAYLEVIDVTVTWRTLLREIGEFLDLSVILGPTEFQNVPCLLRSISYEPQGLKLRLSLWSFQMVPFTGYNPGYAGTVGGQTATITEEI